MTSEIDSLLRIHATVVPEAPGLNFPEVDADDQAVLSEAIAGQANVPVTGDKDLLRVVARAPIKVLSPRGFWELLRAS